MLVIEMASLDNLASLEAWTFSSSLADPWISDAFAPDTQTFTKALQMSLSGGKDESLVSDTIPPFLSLIRPESASKPTVSGVSGSDQEPVFPAPKRQRIAAGKGTKRKSRASKRSQTTFITADPANFRQMVQQVTGVRQMQVPSIVKPDAQRVTIRYQGVGGCLLPTLDTSAFLLEHQQQVLGSAAETGVVGASGLDFDAISSFPTLESWRVM